MTQGRSVRAAWIVFARWVALAAPLCLSWGCPAPGVGPRGTITPATASKPLAFTPAIADPAQKARLLALAPRFDEHLRAKMAKSEATSAAVGIVLDGELVYARGFGLRDISSKAPIDADTVFRIASMTKNFTAAAILKLRDEGTVVLDAPASTYLPEVGSTVGPTRDAPPFTVRHLLTHASGLPFDDMWGPVTFGYDDEGFAQFVRAGVVLAAAPGQRYSYSNLGYAFLGKIVERAAGVRFRKYVTDQILLPLGMTATVWESADVPVNRLAIGYRRNGDKLIPEDRAPDGVFDAAGGLYTSLRDYARYVAFQLAAYPERDDPEAGPIRRSTLREMHAGQRSIRWGAEVPVARPLKDDGLWLSSASYGYGWVNNTTCSYEGMVQHGGYEPGYVSTVHLLPAHGIGIVAFATTGPLGWLAVDGILAILRDGGLLEQRRVLPPTPGLLDGRDTINRLLKSWDPALVDNTFDRQSLRYPWLANLRSDFETLSRTHGACRAEAGLNALDRTQASWRVRCERGEIKFSLSLTPSAIPRIQSIEWKEEFPPDERSSRVAARLAAVVGQWSEDLAVGLFETEADQQKAKRFLGRLGAQYGTCEVDRPISSDGHGAATFRMRCSGSAVELGFRINDKSGLVMDVTGGPPQDVQGTCGEQPRLTE